MDVSSQLNIFHNFVDQVSSSGPPFTPNINTSNITVGQRSGNFGIVINEYDLTNTLKQIKINSQEFSNGVQTLPYVQMYEKINAVDACVYPPTASNILTVNDTIILDNGSGSVDTITTNTITLSGAGIGGPTNTVSQGDMTIQDNTATNTGQITADYVQFSAPSYTSILSATNLSVSDVANSYSSSVSAGIITLTDGNGGNPLNIELDADHTLYPDPQIRLQNSTGLNSYLRFSELNADGHYCYNLTNNEKFFKQNNPFSFSVYTANDGEYIEKNYPFVLADNISVLKLYNPTTYLDDNGNPGWSCLISNLSGSDIQIDTAGYQFYSHANGLQGGPLIFNKWSTGRITLVFSSSTVGDYIWAASLF